MKTLRSRHAAILAAFAVAAGLVTGAHAQRNDGPLETRLEARRVVLAGGRESLVDAANAKPGDVIEYRATYRNSGKAALANLEATVPIPANTEFVEGSARPAGARASTDGVAFSAMPLKRKARTAAGVEVEQTVPLSEYRALRWYPGTLAGEVEVTFTARVRVVDNQPAAPPSTQGRGGG